MQANRPLLILLIEDDPTNLNLVKDALDWISFNSYLYIIENSEKAKRFLEQGGETCIRPDMVLIDLELPDRSGHQLLHWLKSSIELQKIPVVAFTKTRFLFEEHPFNAVNANCYIYKPLDRDMLIDALEKTVHLFIDASYRSLQPFHLLHSSSI
jgi:CheY-like chemotaxis protein